MDQVGSTSVTSDVNGALGDTVKYSAYGEVRAGGTVTDYLYTSQRNEAEIGLDFYVSRFYDPVTGHFIQADTIVPEAGSSKAYDRYGYVGYNPINFNDPSGHCYNYSTQENAAKCNAHWETYTKAIKTSYIEKETSKFGVTLTGFSTDAQINMFYALERMDKTLGGITQFTIGTSFSYRNDPEYYGGLTLDNGSINFHSPNASVPYQNVYHEVAHLINYQSGNFFVNLLNSSAVFVNGEYLMGGPDSNYMRNSFGYEKEHIDDPLGISIDAQQHPGNFPCGSEDGWCVTGNTASEEFADLIANHVSGNYSSKPSGTARNNWVGFAWYLYNHRNGYSWR